MRAMDTPLGTRPSPSGRLCASSESTIPVPIHEDLALQFRDRHGRELLAVAEPVDPSGYAERVAAGALAAFKHGFGEVEECGLEVALAEAFAAADHFVREANHWRQRGDRRRIRVGLAAVAFQGHALVVALAPPGQVLVAQQHQLCAFPALRTWDPRYDLDDAALPAEPLGGDQPVTPYVHQAEAQPGDVAVLGSSLLGRALTTTPTAHFASMRTLTLSERIQHVLAVAGYPHATVLALTVPDASAAVQPASGAVTRPSLRPEDVPVPPAASLDSASGWITRLQEGIAGTVAALTTPQPRPALPARLSYRRPHHLGRSRLARV